MCYFITIGLPKRHAAAMQGAVPRGMALDAVENRSIRRWMPADFETFVLTSGMCSCDLYRSKCERPHADPTELRERYRKRGWSKGWSQARIDRAVRQSLAKSPTMPQFLGLRPDVVHWISGTVRSTGQAAILVHFYNEDLSAGTIEIRQRIVKSLEEFETSPLLDQDVVVILKSPKRVDLQGR